MGYYYKPNIKICQRTKYADVLKIIQKDYGGYVTTRKDVVVSNYCSVDVWEIANRPMVKKFLIDIQPFSLVKKEHIKLMLEFIELPKGQSKNIHKFDAQKEEIYLKLRAINKRGLAETKR